MNGIVLGLRRWPRAVVHYRGLIHAIVSRELSGRYQGSLLGPLWLLIPPVFMIFIYTVVFSQFMQARLPGSADEFGYSVYLCAGLLVWTPFLDAVQRAKGIFIEHANLIKKSAFPRPVLFVPVALVAAVNFCLLAAAFLVFLVFTRGVPHAGLAWVPVCAALAIGLGLAIGAVLAVLNVFFRDVGQITDLAAQLLFWMTPIVYPASILPPGVRDLLAYNPLFGLVSVSQQAARGEPISPWIPLGVPFACALVVALFAALLFSRARADLMDQL